MIPYTNAYVNTYGIQFLTDRDLPLLVSTY
jgi:hypothetical protein